MVLMRRSLAAVANLRYACTALQAGHGFRISVLSGTIRPSFMKKFLLLILLAGSAGWVVAQTPPPSAPPPPRPDHTLGQGPPPQAYTDCKGKKAGEAIGHTTPEGKVAATCQDSPEGLVARPDQPPPRREKPGTNSKP